MSAFGPSNSIMQAAWGSPPAAPIAVGRIPQRVPAAAVPAAAPFMSFAPAARPARPPYVVGGPPARQVTAGIERQLDKDDAKYGTPGPRVHSSVGCHSSFESFTELLNAALHGQRSAEVDALLRGCITERMVDLDRYSLDPRSRDYYAQVQIKKNHKEIIDTLEQLHTFIGKNIATIYMTVEFHGVTNWVVVCHQSGPPPRHEQIITEVRIDKTGAYPIRHGGRYRKRRKTVHKKNKNKKRKTRKH